MTVPIYCVSLVFVIFFAFTSDYTKDRVWHLFGLAMFAILCLGIVAGVDSNNHVRYAFLALGKRATASMASSATNWLTPFLFFCAGWGGIQGTVLINFAYMGNSFGRPAEKRAVAIGLIKWVLRKGQTHLFG